MAIYIIQYYPPPDGVPQPLSQFKEEKIEAKSYIDALDQFYGYYDHDDILPEFRRIYKWFNVNQKTLNRLRNKHLNKYHRSDELDKYLGELVEIAFKNNTTKIGILNFDFSRYSNKCYSLNQNFYFRKSDVKKVEVCHRDKRYESEVLGKWN